MAKKMIELQTPYEVTGNLADYKPAVIRVRLYQGRGGKPQYRLDGGPFSLSVPPVLRHLDGRSVRSVALALAVVLGAAAWVGWRLIGGAR